MRLHHHHQRNITWFSSGLETSCDPVNPQTPRLHTEPTYGFTVSMLNNNSALIDHPLYLGWKNLKIYWEHSLYPIMLDKFELLVSKTKCDEFLDLYLAAFWTFLTSTSRYSTQLKWAHPFFRGVIDGFYRGATRVVKEDWKISQADSSRVC